MISVSDSGISIETEEEILASLKLNLRAELDPALDLSADTPEGAVLLAVVPKIRDCQEKLLESLRARDVTQATGSLLFGLGALNNIPPLPAAKTRVYCTLNLDAGAVVPAGSQGFVVGHPEISGSLVEDVIAVGAGDYAGVFDLDEFGPIEVVAGTFSQIKTPETGWNSLTNAEAGVPGRLAETSEEYRIRRRASLGAIGRGGARAIQANVAKVQGVKDCIVFENATNSQDSRGLPARSFEVLIWDDSANDDQIAQAIFDKYVGGIQSFGTSVGTAQEIVNGVSTPVSVRFTRVQEVGIDVNWSQISANFEASGDYIQAVVDKINSFAPGRDVVFGQVVSAFYSKLTGETEVGIFIGYHGGSVSAGNVVITDRQKAICERDWVTEI